MTARLAQMPTHQHGSDVSPHGEITQRIGKGLLPDEAIFPHASHAARQPEAALLCAVLVDAVESFQGQFVSLANRRARRLSEEAEEWLFSDDCRGVFSFRAICDALDLSPQYIRRGLRSLQQRERRSDRGEEVQRAARKHPARADGENQRRHL